MRQQADLVGISFELLETLGGFQLFLTLATFLQRLLAPRSQLVAPGIDSNITRSSRLSNTAIYN